MAIVSVIIPVYNVKPFLLRCLYSILNGTFRDIEVICVDDGSTDGCGSVLDDVAYRDNRVHVFHTENHGLPAARQLGMTKSTGKYIAFVDSDDFVHEKYLEELVTCAERYNADVVYCPYQRFETDLIHESKEIEPATRSDVRYLWKDGAFCKYVWGRVYKKEILDAEFSGYNEEFQDAIFNMNVVGNLPHPSIYYIKTPMYYYFNRKGSLSNANTHEIRKMNTIDYIYKSGNQGKGNNLLYMNAILWGLSCRWHLILNGDDAEAEDLSRKLSFIWKQVWRTKGISLPVKLYEGALVASPTLYEWIRITLDRSMREWVNQVKKQAKDNKSPI